MAYKSLALLVWNCTWIFNGSLNSTNEFAYIIFETYNRSNSRNSERNFAVLWIHLQLYKFRSFINETEVAKYSAIRSLFHSHWSNTWDAFSFVTLKRLFFFMKAASIMFFLRFMTFKNVFRFPLVFSEIAKWYLKMHTVEMQASEEHIHMKRLSKMKNISSFSAAKCFRRTLSTVIVQSATRIENYERSVLT